MNRIPGLDGARCLAAYAVVMSHSWGPWMADTPFHQVLGTFLGFHVPLFFAISFYLQPITEPPGLSFRKRAARLIRPYLLFSAVYLALRAALYWHNHRSADLQQLLETIPRALADGSSAVHLYFLPALFLGQAAAGLLAPWLRSLTRAGLTGWAAVFLLFLLAFQWMQAMAPLPGSVLVLWGIWISQGLCFFVILRCLTIPAAARFSPRLWIALILWMLANLDLVPSPWMPTTLLRGVSGLWLALEISPLLLAWAQPLAGGAALMFPVYLLHPLVIEGGQLLHVDRWLLGYLGDPGTLVAYTTLVFLLTAGISCIMARVRFLRPWIGL